MNPQVFTSPMELIDRYDSIHSMSDDTLRHREEKELLLTELAKSKIACNCVFHVADALPQERQKNGLKYEVTATVNAGGFLTKKRNFSLKISVPNEANEFVRDLRRGAKLLIEGTLDENGRYLLFSRWEDLFDDGSSYRIINIAATLIRYA